VGCHTDAYEQAKWFGDDISFKAGAVAGKGPAWLLGRLGAERPFMERARVAAAFLGEGRRDMMVMLKNHHGGDGLRRRHAEVRGDE
jgi:hypothetical protein